ncbi:MAG: VRR-NUC domain-containing protein [archaeon]
MTGRDDVYEILAAQAEIEPCPACGHTMKDTYGHCECCGQIGDIEPSSGPDRNMARDDRVCEIISVMHARYKLEDKGFKVVSIKRKPARGPDELNKDYIDKLLEDFSGSQEEVLRLLNENLKGIPDLLCLKDGVLSFVEVKSNKSQLTGDQKKVMKLLKDKGYNARVMKFGVTFNVEDIDKNCNPSV